MDIDPSNFMIFDYSLYIKYQFATGAAIMLLLGAVMLHERVKGLLPITAIAAAALVVNWMTENGFL